MRRLLRVAVALTALLLTTASLAQPIGSEFRVNAYTTGSQGIVDVASGGSGNFVVVWASGGQEGTPFAYGVYAQRYENGVPVGPEFRVNTYTSGNQNLPSVAVDGGGNFVVVWQSDAGGAGQDIFGQRFTSSGTPVGSEFRVNTYTTMDQTSGRVSAGASGAFVVVWSGYDADASGVFGQRYASDGTPSGLEFRVNTYTTASQSSARVAAAASGSFVVVWYGSLQDAGTFGVFAQRFTSAGAPLGSEFRVNTYTTNTQAFPDVATDAAGNFVVVWESAGQDGSGSGVFGRRFASSGAPLGSEFRANTSTTSSERFAKVAVDGAGGFVVVWATYAGVTPDTTDLFAQRYSSSGAPAGPEFPVNTFVADVQRFARVAADESGDFVVVWASNTQDGSMYAVAGQRYCAPLASVSISVNGTTTVCPTGTGGTASVVDLEGGHGTHQWAWRPMGGMSYTPIGGATATSYLITGADFNAGAPAFYELACLTLPQCGTPTYSNTIVVIVSSDGTPPMVTAPPAFTVTQTLCQ